MLNLLFGDRFDFLNLGPASANRSAAVLACALVSGAFLLLRPGRRWPFAGLLLCLVCATLLLATKSRGGLIAAGCGLGLVAVVARPRPSRALLIVGAAALAALVVYGGLHGVWGRFAHGDDSRSELWRAGLAMLWDAPDGVGRGNAADFFAQWYQEVGDRRGYLSLVNFHLDWLAGHGLATRAGYALAWAGLAWLVWPRRASPLLTTAAGVWLAFFVAAIFSTTAKVWQVWALPLAWLLAVAIRRGRQRDFASGRVALACAGGVLLALVGLHVIGWHLSETRLVVGPRSLRWGEGPPRVILYDPNPDILGNKWGHDVRASGETIQVLHPGAALAGETAPDAVWILSGKLPDALPAKVRVRVFNLPASAETLAWLEKQEPASLAIVLSDSLCGDLRCEDWLKWSERHPETSVRLIGGTGLYIPDWVPSSVPDGR